LCLTVYLPQPWVFAQNAGTNSSDNPSADSTPLDEVVVTGTRIVRDGYQAPTPLTVVSEADLQRSPDTSLVNTLNALPAVTGALTPSSGSSGLAPGTAGLELLNLRALGTNRVLVLFDGQRMVPADLTNDVNIAVFPQQLIKRVDVVTGGASAVYGSDAVSGVVNFVLDKNFTGLKGEVSGGQTTYMDDRNYKIDLTSGFGFANDRGHVLLSGEYLHNDGIDGDGGRHWLETGVLQIPNPAYTPTNGQPSQIVQPNSSISAFAPGGLIVSGPLKGTTFGANGTPYQFQYGPIVGPTYMVGGDWLTNQETRNGVDLDPAQTNANVFGRVSYDLNSNVTAFVDYVWNQSKLSANLIPPWILGGANSPSIQIDNAYLPASVQSAMVANGITSFKLGAGNADLPAIGSENQRTTNRINAGFEGKFDALNTTWKWDVNFVYGETSLFFQNLGAAVTSRYLQAIDAVVNPANGQIVCRSTLTNPGNGCRPFDPMGIGVNANNQAGISWIDNNGQGAWQSGDVQQRTYSGSISGEPFSLWAGPISVAGNFEHRQDSINVVTDSFSYTGGHILGNLPSLAGSESVTEGALETVVPLAKDLSWAKSLDLNAAARYTDYSVSGNVTTWKLGVVYKPIQDITFRATRSLDIRAPNLFELFKPQSYGAGNPTVIDPFLPGSPAYAISGYFISTGNPDLQPERAHAWGVGIVLEPRFIPNFTASIDFWDVDVKDAISSLTPQQIVNGCFSGQLASACGNIVRDPTTGLITSVYVKSVNLATQDVDGLDVETSYHFALADLSANLRGDVSLHGFATFYFKNYQYNTFAPATDEVGVDAVTSTGQAEPPHWKTSLTAAYSLSPIEVSLTGRAISGGVIDSTYIQCTIGCPAATPYNATINNNSIPGRFYLDGSIAYQLHLGDSSGQVFFSVKNILNTNPPPIPGAFYANQSSSSSFYDVLGTVMRLGVRFNIK
jgi:outer membrane receptor protein involved in Fe transport